MSPEPASEFVNFVVTVDRKVARIALVRQASRRAMEQGRDPEAPHWELQQILRRVQLDRSVRVVVIEGEQDGEFLCPTPRGGSTVSFGQPSNAMWRASTSILRMHQAMARLDVPIIAKVNGDAISLGASIVYAADLIVAREDARIADNRLGMGEVDPMLTRLGAVPADGGISLAPLFMSAARAKEYLMLARVDTAVDLARRGIINYAVPAAELDALVDGLVARLLRRPADALAWTKRVANQRIVDRIHRTLDPSVAYGMVNMYQVVDDGSEIELPRST